MLKRLSLLAVLLSASLVMAENASTQDFSLPRLPSIDTFFKNAPRQYFIKTSDGWTLSLYRYMPKKIDKNREPVILCHGFNYNSYIWDLDEKHTLARYLRDKGYDVWAVNLRGSGDSSKPALSDLRALTKLQFEKMPQILMRAPMNINRYDWTVDDHIHKDLPAIIEFVKSRTAKSEVTWIGHSMGGMVMFGYLVSENPKNIKRFVAVGSMVNVKQPPNPVLALVAAQKPITDASLLINTTVAYQLRNLTLGAFKLPWEELFYNKENMDDITAIQMFRIAIDDTAPGIIAHFSEIIKSGDFISIDKRINYTANLPSITTPILLIAGQKDSLGTLDTAHYAYEHISSSNKHLEVFSRENGYSADYGHCDLLLGKKSQDEVYPFISRWLEEN